MWNLVKPEKEREKEQDKEPARGSPAVDAPLVVLGSETILAVRSQPLQRAHHQQEQPVTRVKFQGSFGPQNFLVGLGFVLHGFLHE